MGTPSNSTTPTLPRFELGQLCQTPGAQAVLQRYRVNPFLLIGRHLQGDWGDVCKEDARANEDALQEGARVLSSYVLSGCISPNRRKFRRVLSKCLQPLF